MNLDVRPMGMRVRVISDALTYDWAIFAVVESIGSTCEILDGETINDYAQRLLGEYVEDGKFIEFIDD